MSSEQDDKPSEPPSGIAAAAVDMGEAVEPEAIVPTTGIARTTSSNDGNNNSSTTTTKGKTGRVSSGRAVRPGAVAMSGASDSGNEINDNDEEMRPAPTSRNVMPGMPASRNRRRGAGGAPAGKARGMAPATQPGAVSVSNEEAAAQDTEAPPAAAAADGRGKVRGMAPASRPGAVSVSHSSATATQAVEDVAVQEPGAVVASSPSNTATSASVPASRLNRPRGKARTAAPAVKPGAVSVSGEGSNPDTPGPSTSQFGKNRPSVQASRPGAVAVVSSAPQVAKAPTETVSASIDTPNVMVQDVVSEPVTMVTSSVGVDPDKRSRLTQETSSLMPANRRGAGPSTTKGRRGTPAQLPGAVAVTGNDDDQPTAETLKATRKISTNSDADLEVVESVEPNAVLGADSVSTTSSRPRSLAPIPSSRPDRGGKSRRGPRAIAPGAVDVVESQMDQPVATATTVGAVSVPGISSSSLDSTTGSPSIVAGKGGPRANPATVPGAVSSSTGSMPDASSVMPVPASRPDRSGKGRRGPRASAPGAVDVVEDQSDTPLATADSSQTDPSASVAVPSASTVRSGAMGGKSRRGTPATMPGAVSGQSDGNSPIDVKSRLGSGNMSTSSGITVPASRGARFSNRGATEAVTGKSQDKDLESGNRDLDVLGEDPALDDADDDKAKEKDRSVQHAPRAAGGLGHNRTRGTREEQTAPVRNQRYDSGVSNPPPRRAFRPDAGSAMDDSTATTTMGTSTIASGAPTYPLLRPAAQEEEEDSAPVTLNAPVTPFEDWQSEEREKGIKNAEIINRRRRFRIQLVVILMILITGGAVGGIFAATSGSRSAPAPGTSAPTDIPSASPTAPPSIDRTVCLEHDVATPFSDRYSTIRDLFVASGVPTSFDTIGTNARRALCWLAEQDLRQIRLVPSNRPKLIERYTMVTLFYALKATSDFSGWLGPDDVCIWRGVDCYVDSVSTITMNGAGIQGTIPSEVSLLSSLGE